MRCIESRTRPCLLHQIKRCSAPCTGEISPDDYAALVGEARAFLSGPQPGRARATRAPRWTRPHRARLRAGSRFARSLAALSAIQSQQGINLRGVDEADVFAAHQDGGFTCIEVFFFRAGQNWGNRAYFPRADRSLGAAEVLGEFLAQFYDDKPCPRCIFLSHDIAERELLAEALAIKRATRSRSAFRVAVSGSWYWIRPWPMRARRSDANSRTLRPSNACLAGLAGVFGLAKPPQRVEVYDNSHIQGTNAVGAMIVAGPEGFRKNQYRKFNIRAPDQAPGDDFAMMREVLGRRFKRLIEKRRLRMRPPAAAPDEDALPPWPDLVIVDGGEGQLTAAREALTALGVDKVVLVAIAKGPDRDAGRETFHQPGRAPFRLPPRDPVLYFIQRLRDEAHRFAIGSHRARRRLDIREAGLQEIPGVGPRRKRALLRHFGTLKAIERASAGDLMQVAGISADMARRIYDFFHEAGR